MILLQAAMAAGLILVILYCIFLIIGTPFLVGLFMKGYWRLVGKKNNITDGKPYYKEPLPFVLSVILCLAMLTGLFYSCVFLLFFRDFYFI